MDTKETKAFLSQMQAAYPADLFFEKLKGREAPTIEIWAEALKEVELDCATRFLVGWMKTNTRVPAACDVYQFHKQELIDKRMRIESVQESYIGDDRNILREVAIKMYEEGRLTNPNKPKKQEQKDA